MGFVHTSPEKGFLLQQSFWFLNSIKSTTQDRGCTERQVDYCRKVYNTLRINEETYNREIMK